MAVDARSAEQSGPVWDARAAHDVGVFIRRYLWENPPPAGAIYAADFQKWADNLASAGLRELADLGVGHLHTIDGEGA